MRKSREKNFVSIIVPAKNEGQLIGACLNSLILQSYPKHLYEIIVADNNSTDETEEIAKKYHVILVKADGHVGAVRNSGAQSAKGDVLAFIDADCVAPPDWLNRCVNLLHGSNNTVYGGGVKNPLSANWIEKCWILENENHPNLPKELIGANICLKKRQFLSAGGFNEHVTSGEDTELSLSLKKMGLKVEISPLLNVTHMGNAKTIKEFVTRQMWHAENYLENFKHSIRDPMFILIIAFLLSTIGCLILCIFLSPLLILAILITGILPLLLTFKRLLRSGIAYPGLETITKCYALDFLYLIGRACGVVKSFFTKMHLKP